MTNTRNLGRVVLTGAAGRIGTVVRAALRDEAEELVLLDRVEVDPLNPVERARQLDLLDLDGMIAAFDGADSVVHLGGIPDEAGFAEVMEANVQGTYHVLEAARRQGVRRVVLASSNRAAGFYPVSELVSPARLPRPDGFYGVSKVAVEALGRLYADKFGLSVVCLRIGSFEEEPRDTRHLATWLSPRDCVGFVRAALTAPDASFTTVYAVSANTRRYWDTSDALGYVAVDNAEMFAGKVSGVEPAPDSPQGGVYAEAAYTLRHI
jgi:uronate dehydrogenase